MLQNTGTRVLEYIVDLKLHKSDHTKSKRYRSRTEKGIPGPKPGTGR